MHFAFAALTPFHQHFITPINPAADTYQDFSHQVHHSWISVFALEWVLGDFAAKGVICLQAESMDCILANRTPARTTVFWAVFWPTRTAAGE